MFKTVVLVWKCLNLAAGYLSELCVHVAPALGRVVVSECAV